VLPIESNVRELEAKALLACVAAERGFAVVLMRIADFGRVVPQVPPAVVLHKDVIGKELIDLARAAGHVAVALDEEGLVQRDPDDYLLRRVSVDALERCARFLAWGEVHRSTLLRKLPSFGDRVVPTGSSRFDLLRPELRELYRAPAELLTQRHGPFVMVNSNFGTANHRLGPDYVRRHWGKGGWSSGPGREQLLDRIVRLQSTLLEEFTRAVAALAEEMGDDCSVVVRPHPSEDHSTWRDRLQGVPNVSVQHEGPVLPWLLASRALVHNSCTTGIEATLLDRPTFAYLPVRDEPVESGLPNDVSTKVLSCSDLVDAVRGAVRGRPAPVRTRAGQELLARHVSRLSGALASEAAVDQIDEVAPEGGVRLPALLPLRVEVGRAQVTARSYAAAVRGGTLPAQRRYDALLKQTSPGLAVDTVRQVVAGLHDATGRFGQVRCRRLARDVVVVQSTE
jgi:surface carbohydrate biosynthesis protein